MMSVAERELAVLLLLRLFFDGTTVPETVNNEGLPGGGGPCSLVPFQNCPMFPCSHTFSECFRTVIFRILFPCSQKLANVPLFPSIFCQCSLVPKNPWETLNNITQLITHKWMRGNLLHKNGCFLVLRRNDRFWIVFAANLSL